MELRSVVRVLHCIPFFFCQRQLLHPPQEKVRKARDKLAAKTAMYDRKVARMKRKAAAKAAAIQAKKTALASTRGRWIFSCC